LIQFILCYTILLLLSFFAIHGYSPANCRYRGDGWRFLFHLSNASPQNKEESKVLFSSYFETSLSFYVSQYPISFAQKV